jgi:putative flippase GtrA
MPKKTITSFIDFFYPPFKRIMPLQTFRYAACGGANVLLDITLFNIIFIFILHKQILDLGFFAFQPYTAATLLSFCITFPIGFLLSKYVVWVQSNLRGHVQLFRYFVLVMVCLLLNYVFIKIFVEYLHIYPPYAKILTTIIVVAFSYLSQKHFTFKVQEDGTA